MKCLKNQKGLTLIELLVVIVILGIIAAIAIPMVMSNRDDATKNTNAQNKAILQDAVNRYYTVEGTSPVELKDLVDKNYIDKVPTCAESKDKNFKYVEGKNPGEAGTVNDGQCTMPK